MKMNFVMILKLYKDDTIKLTTPFQLLVKIIHVNVVKSITV